MNPYEHKLQERGIRVTAVRLLILKAMMSHPQAFSLADMEEKLDTVDKSTLFRTISLFHNKRLIHSIDDGSGSMKYSVCSSACLCMPADLHAHFACTGCKKTFCLEGVHIPQVKMPEGFELESINFVMKGLCAACAARENRGNA